MNAEAAPPSRPTEAQLRWAQFRFKRRAASIKQTLEVFWQTPASVSEVEDALSEDGNTTEESVDDTPSSPPVPRPIKPLISRGRRALLRVSKRRFLQRQIEIQKNGYKCGLQDEDSSSSEEEDDGLALIFADDRYIRRRRRRQHRKHGGADELDRAKRFDDAFHAMMMTLAAAQPQQHEFEAPTRIWTRPDGTEGLFENIDYEGMKLLGNYGGRADPKLRNSVIAPTTPLDRGASWMVHLPRKSRCLPSQQLYSLANSRARPEDIEEDDRFSMLSDMRSSAPGVKSFRDIVDRLQQQLIIGPIDSDDFETPFKSVPRMKLAKYFIPANATNARDEKKEDVLVQYDIGSATPLQSTIAPSPMIRSLARQLDPELMHQIDAVSPGLSVQMLARCLEETGFDPKKDGPEKAQQHLQDFARQYLTGADNFRSPIVSVSPFLDSPPSRQQVRDGASPYTEDSVSPFLRSSSSASLPNDGTVKQFVEKMELAARKTQLVSVDGKLLTPQFATLIEKYLLEVREVPKRRPVPKKEQASRTKRRSANESPSREDVHEESTLKNIVSSSHAVRNLVQKLEQAFVNQPFIDPSGVLKADTFEAIVARILNESNLDTDDDIAASSNHGVYKNAAMPLQSNYQASQEFIDDFATQIEKAAKVEPIVQLNGQVDLNALERLITSYLNSANQHGVERTVPSTSKVSAQVSMSELLLLSKQGAVRELVRQIEETSVQTKLIDSQGRVDYTVFRTLVHRYMEKTLYTKSNPEPVMSRPDSVESPFIESFVSLFVESVKEQQLSLDVTEALDHDAVLDAANTCFTYVADVPLFDSSRLTDSGTPPKDKAPALFVSSFIRLFNENSNVESEKIADNALSLGRLQVTVRACAEEALRLELGDTYYPQAVAISPPSKLPRGIKVFETSRDFAGRVPSGLSGLATMLQSARYSHDDHDAVAAFKLAQKERRGEEDASSISSFRVIPKGLKNMVRSLRNSNLSLRVENQFAPSEEEEEEEVDSLEDAAQLVGSPGMPTASITRDSTPNFSQFHVRDLTHHAIERSGLIGDRDGDGSIIDTDGTDVGTGARDQQRLSNLLLSPTILTKRHQQAIRAIEDRHWEQVQYLLKANPWLAEMSDHATNQYLLHKLALYGSGEVIGIAGIQGIRYSPAPEELNVDLIRMFSNAIHKFDRDGNIPLHMAAAAANISMIVKLGERFPSGASVRNEDGMLPLHLVILALGSLGSACSVSPVDMVKAVLDCFPAAVVVADNDGNLPIHAAVGALQDDDGADVVYLLLDEAEKLVREGHRFNNKQRISDADESSIDAETIPLIVEDSAHCTTVLNRHDETPLVTAIRSQAGWKVINALIGWSGGAQSVLWTDYEGDNALHLLVSETYNDSASIMAVLKAVPEAAAVRNKYGMLPVEIACLNLLPEEVILALVLVDLPFEVDDIRCEKVRDGFGSSWFYLTCECDDHYLAVVEEVLNLCSYPQIRALCFYNDDILSRASPKCREAMQRSLRFMGRFEFVSNSALSSPNSSGYQLFAAVDYDDRVERRVLLKNYTNHDLFEQETSLLRETELDASLVEEILFFAVNSHGLPATQNDTHQYCISIEQPDLTLAGVLQGMLKSQECQTNFAMRKRYADKVFSLLRIVAKALKHLHSFEIIHGSVSLENCGRFKTTWKLTSMIGSQRVGEKLSPMRLARAAPPESIISVNGAFKVGDDLAASCAQDVWGFGKMAYDILVGDQLVMFDDNEIVPTSQDALAVLHGWDDLNIDEASQHLARVGVSEEGINLISHCLAADPGRRPPMDAVLQHPCWKSLRR